MTNKANFIPAINGRGYREVVTPANEERAITDPHYVAQDGHLRAVYPANGSTLGQLADQASGALQACLRLDHAHGPTSLMQILSVDELCALASGMNEIADEMERAAAAMLAAALGKGKPS